MPYDYSGYDKSFQNLQFGPTDDMNTYNSRLNDLRAQRSQFSGGGSGWDTWNQRVQEARSGLQNATQQARTAWQASQVKPVQMNPLPQPQPKPTGTVSIGGSPGTQPTTQPTGSVSITPYPNTNTTPGIPQPTQPGTQPSTQQAQQLWWMNRGGNYPPGQQASIQPYFGQYPGQNQFPNQGNGFNTPWQGGPYALPGWGRNPYQQDPSFMRNPYPQYPPQGPPQGTSPNWGLPPGGMGQYPQLPWQNPTSSPVGGGQQPGPTTTPENQYGAPGSNTGVGPPPQPTQQEQGGTGTQALEFYTDTSTGQQYARSSSNGTWQPVSQIQPGAPVSYGGPSGTGGFSQQGFQPQPLSTPPKPPWLQAIESRNPLYQSRPAYPTPFASQSQWNGMAPSEREGYMALVPPAYRNDWSNQMQSRWQNMGYSTPQRAYF